jgi:hypothetical protein
MLFLAAAAVVASGQQPPARGPVAPTVQARATIRVLSGATVRFGQVQADGDGTQRNTIIRTEGSVQAAKLIEFSEIQARGSPRLIVSSSPPAGTWTSALLNDALAPGASVGAGGAMVHE